MIHAHVNIYGHKYSKLSCPMSNLLITNLDQTVRSRLSEYAQKSHTGTLCEATSSQATVVIYRKYKERYGQWHFVCFAIFKHLFLIGGSHMINSSGV